MSPAAASSSPQVYGAMYDSLTTLGPDAAVLPRAAEKWQQVDPLTWRFTLRKDLVFSNGDKFTADDVEFTVNSMVSERWPQNTGLPNVTGAKKIDDYTVDYITKVPDASVLVGNAGLWIVPKNYYETVGKDGFAAKPIGTGPYDLVEFRTADIAVLKLKTTPHPFRKPVATQLTFRSITEQTQMTNGLKTGDLQIVLGQLAPDQINLMEKNGAKVDSRMTGANGLLFSQPEAIQRNTPLTNKTVRLALNYAVDKEAIAQKIYSGRAQPIGQISVPSSPGWDPNVKPIPYDPAMAKKLLAEAGYPNGFKLPTGIEFTPLTGNANMMVAVQSYLKDVGVEADVTQFELAPFLDKFYGRNNAAKGDLFMFSTGDTNTFATGMYQYFTCNKPVHWWCNPDLDKYFALSASEPDVKKRGELMRKAIATLRDDVGVLFLVNVPHVVVYTGKVKNFDRRSDTGYDFDSVYLVE